LETTRSAAWTGVGGKAAGRQCCHGKFCDKFCIVLPGKESSMCMVSGMVCQFLS
jgi:hypothetical protein